jgi:hypothetical protein
MMLHFYLYFVRLLNVKRDESRPTSCRVFLAQALSCAGTRYQVERKKTVTGLDRDTGELCPSRLGVVFAWMLKTWHFSKLGQNMERF